MTAIAQRDTRRSAVNIVTEWTFTSALSHADPFNQVEMDAVFTDPKGSRLRVPAFWAGGKSWKVRYSSPIAGRHTFTTDCSDRSDSGLHRKVGAVELDKVRTSNPLLKHGPIVIAPNRRTFVHRDGEPFFWLGDTWWMSLCKRMSFPEDFDRLADDRVKKGFTVVQIVAGLYPDMPAFDPRGANETGFPWERANPSPALPLRARGGSKEPESSVQAGGGSTDGPSHDTKPQDYLRINPAYFDAADKRIARLVEKGLVPCIVGAWGYHLPWLGEAKLKQHWRYLVARWGAYPVFWCVAGEANLPYYLAPGFPYDDRKQVTGWTEIARYLRKLDPYRRPMSIHPTGLGKLSARHAIDDPTLIDFDMLQTGHGDRGSLGPTVDTMRASYADKPTMPVLNSEVCYEGIMNSCRDDVQRLLFWPSMLSGGCGHTYGANGIWQMNQPGIPYGKSPHGGTYGPTPWSEAMNLPGSAQLGLAKRLLVSLGADSLEPHPEWAAFDGVHQGVVWGDWIWYPEGRPNEDAPAEPRYFRYTVAQSGAKPKRAVVRVAADDRCTVWFNGQEVGARLGWRPALEIDVTRLWRNGKNVVAVRAENLSAPVQKNPAGLLFTLTTANARPTSGGPGVRQSESHWKCSKVDAPGWTAVDFDDSAWVEPAKVAKYGEGPWGKVEANDGPYMQPYAAGAADGTRVIYLPASRTVRLKRLSQGAAYTSFWWDPVTGRQQKIAPIAAGQDGLSPPLTPPVAGQDWVLILQPRKR